MPESVELVPKRGRARMAGLELRVQALSQQLSDSVTSPL